MGIPSFFSYIVKQHTRNVLFNAPPPNTSFTHLFIDANSLIYDVFNRLKAKPEIVKGDIEDCIIGEVGNSLDTLIRHIGPTMKTYIAFDGVCPLAKMKHQRNRRLKSYVLNTPLMFGGWDTTNVTPGTPFMKKLTEQLKAHYLGNNNVNFSGADEIGEGESKICHYMRSINASSNGTFAFYGLDNDIIMLSILHLHCAKNIFVFREEFVPSKDVVVGKPKGFLYLNIRALSNSILYEMRCADANPSRVIDYVFMCFFLGNDFLPKFPAIQIRTHGITLLLDTYRKHIGGFHGRRLVCFGGGVGGGTTCINWRWVALFIQKLAETEHHFITMEDELRDKLEASVRRTDGALDDPENMPILYREVEHYVCAKEVGWEIRYYRALFDTTIDDKTLKGICVSYLEGLEWTFKYYTGECPNWRWVYPHEYPPLLGDLALSVPRGHTFGGFFANCVYNPYSGEEQLAYVMPPNGQTDQEKRRMIGSLEWKWAYCRYLWECHVSIK
jgi:5'-3' exonuclease